MSNSEIVVLVLLGAGFLMFASGLYGYRTAVKRTHAWLVTRMLITHGESIVLKSLIKDYRIRENVK